jgi:hypothetical protein
VHEQHAVDFLCGEHDAQGLDVSLDRCIANDVYWVTP